MDIESIKQASLAAQKMAWFLWSLGMRARQEPDTWRMQNYRDECLRMCEEAVSRIPMHLDSFAAVAPEPARFRGLSYASWHGAAYRIACQLAASDLLSSALDGPGWAQGLAMIGKNHNDWHFLEEALKKERARVLDVIPGEAKSVVADLTGYPRHSPDFTWMVVNDITYQFSKGNQARAMKALFEAWEAGGRRDGLGVSEETIGEMIGSASGKFRMQVTFQGHEAFRTIIRSPSKGVYALYLSPPALP